MSVKKKTCDEFHQGTCRAEARAGRLTYCPRARAFNAPPGTCCHHPFYRAREQLRTLKRAGVNLARYGKRIKKPEFVERLYQAYLRARKRAYG